MTTEKSGVASWPYMAARKMGSYRPTPEWWKKLVREELQRRGRGSRSQLAKFVGCSTSAITQLLAPSTTDKPSPDSSRIAAKVAEWTNVPLPDEAAYDSLTEFVSEAQRLEKLNPKALDHALEIVRALRIAEERARGDGEK